MTNCYIREYYPYGDSDPYIFTHLLTEDCELALILDPKTGYDLDKDLGEIESGIYERTLRQNQVEDLITIRCWEI